MQTIPFWRVLEFLMELVALQMASFANRSVAIAQHMLLDHSEPTRLIVHFAHLLISYIPQVILDD